MQSIKNIFPIQRCHSFISATNGLESRTVIISASRTTARPCRRRRAAWASTVPPARSSSIRTRARRRQGRISPNSSTYPCGRRARRPKNAIATSILRSLNADFTSDDKGLVAESALCLCSGPHLPHDHGDAFAEVLSGIVNRWNEYRDDQKDKAPFNIGSGLFLRQPPTADTVLASNDRSCASCCHRTTRTRTAPPMRR